MGLYELMQKKAEGLDLFVLHDGPPFANGHIHIGHALNKILKDIVLKNQYKLGKATPFVPGWDCHGLPIEAKIEEKYREKGIKKDDVPRAQFREDCQTFAEGWITIQRAEFKRLGVTADWVNPYTTMAPEAEAEIVRLMGMFLMNGSLYRGIKPVMWSVVEKTALAEMEVEYMDHRVSLDLCPLSHHKNSHSFSRRGECRYLDNNALDPRWKPGHCLCTEFGLYRLAN